MQKKNLSTVANDVIAAYGITATNVINTCRFGGERVVGFVDQRFATAVNRGVPALRQDVRSNLIDAQQRVGGYYVKGIRFGADRAQDVVGAAVDLAVRGVSIVAANAERFDRAANLNALDRLNRIAMPAAGFVSMVAERIEDGSSNLVTRVAGKPVPAKAVATRRLGAATRKAAATRKRVTKTTTTRVSKAVAKAATSTSNTARRVARKATAAAKAA